MCKMTEQWLVNQKIIRKDKLKLWLHQQIGVQMTTARKSNVLVFFLSTL